MFTKLTHNTDLNTKLTQQNETLYAHAHKFFRRIHGRFTTLLWVLVSWSYEYIWGCTYFGRIKHTFKKQHRLFYPKTWDPAIIASQKHRTDSQNFTEMIDAVRQAKACCSVDWNSRVVCHVSEEVFIFYPAEQTVNQHILNIFTIMFENNIFLYHYSKSLAGNLRFSFLYICGYEIKWWRRVMSLVLAWTSC